MQLRSLKIENFRSIGSAELGSLSEMNVLIGRNNAGKSAVMRAASLFFQCIRDGKPVNIAPAIRNKFDFHMGDTSRPIKISAAFNLSLSERDGLIREVGQEYPQMQNAIEGIAPSLVATVTLEVSAVRGTYTSSVSRIELAPSGVGAVSEAITLLDLPPTAVEELAEKLRHGAEYVQRVEVLQAAIPSLRRNLRQLRAMGSDSRYVADYISTEVPPHLSSAAQSILPQVTRLAKDPDDYEQVFSNELAKAETRLAEVMQRPAIVPLRTFAGETTEIPQHIGSLLGRIADLKVHYLTENRKQIGRSEAQRLLELKVSRGGPEVLRRIQETVLGLLGVSIDAFQSTGQVSSRAPAAELDVDDFLVEVNGSGIREALRVVLDVEFNKPDILLVEEPEVHLHPALEVALMRYLKSVGDDTQVILATHSTNFLDTGDMNSVYLVKKNGATSISRLSLVDAEVEVPKELGIRLSSLFMYDKLIFVEGASDELILREVAARLKINFTDKNVGFVVMGGVANFTHYAAQATLDFLTKRQVHSHFIIDRDERQDSDVASLKSLLNDRASLHVLDRRELENFLLDSEAVASLIQRRVEDLQVDASAIEKEFDEACEKLKERAVELRASRALCSPVYLRSKETSGSTAEHLRTRIDQAIAALQERASRVDGEFESRRQEVELNWEASKRDLVPGTLILSEVFAKYGIKYQKDRDGAAISRSIDPARMPRSLQNILNRIVADGPVTWPKR